MNHALTELCLHRLCMLLNMRRFIQEENSIFHIKQLQKRNGFFIEIIHIAVQVCRIPEFHHLLFEFFDMRGNPVGFLGMKFIPELLFKCCGFLLDLFHPGL